MRCVVTLNQSEMNRISGESNVPFMTLLANFSQTNLLYKTANSASFKKPAKLIVFFAQADKNHSFIISYLNKFPLMSSKHLNFLSFVKASQHLGKRLSAKEIKEIRLLKQSMNRKRTEFN